ncbi:MAG: penicillin-binding protein 1C [Alphaproteobacteria bacterium]|nr:penicillin-binding protein 1C [Alphaproteobacteria bacterium]
MKLVLPPFLRGKESGGDGPPANSRRSAWIVAGFSALGLVLALAVADRLTPLERSRADDRSVIVAAADGTLLRTFISHDGAWRLPVKLDQVDERYVQLLLAWEDQRFRDHPGVDPIAILRAAYQMAAKARVVSGASTITMQVARLMEPRERTLPAKLLQMTRALQIDWHLQKKEILELYLTLAPYGGNLEGVRAASFAWFGKEPKRLTIGEAALLVALPQSPERRRPDRHPDIAKAARDRVIATLAERGAITAREALEATQEPIPTRRQRFPFHAPHLAQDLLARNATAEPVIVSTLDANVQTKLEDLGHRERAYFDDDANLAVIVVENSTRNVIAYLGGANFWGQSGQVDLANAARSPGSTLKPFIYGIAFDDLVVHPQTLIDDKPTAFGDYEPRNFDRGFQGTVTITAALQQSLNVPAVALLDRISPLRLASTMRNAGAELTFPKKGALPSLPMALGGVGISLRDLTMLYVGIPNAGEVRPLRFVKGVIEGEPHRLFGAPAAWYLSNILKTANLPDGWSMGQGIERAREIAFKTGTSYGYRDAWSIGFSHHYTAGIWVGRADGSTRVGHIGRNDAAPLLMKVFDLLPQEGRAPDPAPDGAYLVQNAEQLPRALQRFRPNSKLVAGLKRIQPPRISFPPNGAVVSLVDPKKPQALPLKAQGGRAPLRWVINGAPLSGSDSWWTPDGAGFARVTVVDADGRSDTSQIRLKAEN